MSEIAIFDADSADATLLEDFERWCATQRTMLGRDHVRTPEEAKADEVAYFEAEKRIEEATPTTIAGIVAQLGIAATVITECGSLEQAIIYRGWLAAYAERDEHEGSAKMLIGPINALLRIDWEQKLAAYDLSQAHLHAILGTKVEVGSKAVRIGDVSGEVDDLIARFSGAEEISALARTLVPDLAAFDRKAQIVGAEGYQAEAWPWMLRDVRFLMGNLAANPYAKKEAARCPANSATAAASGFPTRSRATSTTSPTRSGAAVASRRGSATTWRRSRSARRGSASSMIPKTWPTRSRSIGPACSPSSSATTGAANISPRRLRRCRHDRSRCPAHRARTDPSRWRHADPCAAVDGRRQGLRRGDGAR
jgi:hypothetical protein